MLSKLLLSCAVFTSVRSLAAESRMGTGGTPQREENEAEARDFADYDRNADGKITCDEVQHVLTERGMSITQQSLVTIFTAVQQLHTATTSSQHGQRAAACENQTLSREEFSAFVRLPPLTTSATGADWADNGVPTAARLSTTVGKHDISSSGTPNQNIFDLHRGPNEAMLAFYQLDTDQDLHLSCEELTAGAGGGLDNDTAATFMDVFSSYSASPSVVSDLGGSSSSGTSGSGCEGRISAEEFFNLSLPQSTAGQSALAASLARADQLTAKARTTRSGHHRSQRCVCFSIWFVQVCVGCPPQDGSLSGDATCNHDRECASDRCTVRRCTLWAGPFCLSFERRCERNRIRPGSHTLTQPPSLFPSRDGVLRADLSIQRSVIDFRGGSRMTTRTINGNIPGPTLRLRPGNELRVHFRNRLTKQHGTSYHHNEFSAPDESNLHYHGLHVSGELPSDDVTVPVVEGSSRRYVSRLPSDHMPGTHWYHPHRHGSTLLQVAGGAAGVIIVEDLPGTLPQGVAGAPEIVLMVMWVGCFKLEQAAQKSNDRLWRVDHGCPNMLLNGKELPTVDVAQHVWTRLRVVWAAWEWDALDLRLPGCEMQLLAKDGVYIRDFPRPIQAAPIAPGGRADIMIRCRGNVGSTSEITTWNRQLVGYIRVISSSSRPVELASSWSPQYPGYLSDLRRSPPSPGCSCPSYATAPFSSNGHLFNPDQIMHQSYVGAVVERVLQYGPHPYHQHVHPFQLVGGLFITGEERGYNRMGDWHDTIQGDGVIRFRPDTFAGTMMVHCHRLEHEDHGMMYLESVAPSSSSGGCRCTHLSFWDALLHNFWHPSELAIHGGAYRSLSVNRGPSSKPSNTTTTTDDSTSSGTGTTLFISILCVVVICMLLTAGAAVLMVRNQQNQQQQQHRLGQEQEEMLVAML